MKRPKWTQFRRAQGAIMAAKQKSRAAASFPRQCHRRRAGSKRIASSRNGANQATTFPSVHTPQAAPASAARPGEGDRTRRTDARTARVVTRTSVGSWRTKTTRVTSRGFTDRKSPPASAQPREADISRNSRNAATTPRAWRIDWKTAAESTDEVPVRKNQPPSRAENSGGRYTMGVIPSWVNPVPAATFRAAARYPTASFFTAGSG